jgi:hypothetical protein
MLLQTPKKRTKAFDLRRSVDVHCMTSLKDVDAVFFESGAPGPHDASGKQGSER